MTKDISVQSLSDIVLAGFGRLLKNVVCFFGSDTESTRNLPVARLAGCIICSSATQPF